VKKIVMLSFLMLPLASLSAQADCVACIMKSRISGKGISYAVNGASVRQAEKNCTDRGGILAWGSGTRAKDCPANGTRWYPKR